MLDRFQVDLAGMVDLLSSHLYSGPQAYLRELLQNAVDAITARQQLDAQAPARVRLSTGVDATGTSYLDVVDTGIGLTATEAAEFLATIGRSSKRETELGLGRGEFLGQFGIGMMAAFMVADQVEVISRSARPEAVPIRWTGRAEGTFEVADHAGDLEVGTRVRLLARAGFEHWLDEKTVVALAEDYGSLLGFDIAVEVSIGDDKRWRRVTVPELPWRVRYPNPDARAAALSHYCEQTLGFTPLTQIDLDVPLAGVSGVAFVLPQTVAQGSGQHRLYSKRMLLGARVSGLLPDWAFFVRAVLDSDALSPTASREQLHSDEILLATRDALGRQLKEWATTTLSGRSNLAHRFIEVHHLALRALARSDDDMLDLVAKVLPFETSEGVQTLSQVASSGEVVFTNTTEAYRRVAAVARAQGLAVVNAGYVYDSDLLDRLGRRPGWRVRELASEDLVQVLQLLNPAREAEVASALVSARAILAAEDCEVLVRRFDPAEVPAVLLRDPAGEQRRELELERNVSPGLWDGLLDSLTSGASARSRTLALNDSASVVRQLLATGDQAVFAAALRALYLSAVMLAGEGLRSAEVASLNDALSQLLSASLGRSEPTGS